MATAFLLLGDLQFSPPAEALSSPWLFLLVGYAITVALETPILLLGLSPYHPWRRRLFAGLWLTACTYPVVVLVLPPLIAPLWGRVAYLAVAETFAPAAECLLFYWTFWPRSFPGDEAARDPGPQSPREPLARSSGSSSSPGNSAAAQGVPGRPWLLQDCAAIVLANLVSFLVGLWWLG